MLLLTLKLSRPFLKATMTNASSRNQNQCCSWSRHTNSEQLTAPIILDHLGVVSKGYTYAKFSPSNPHACAPSRTLLAPHHFDCVNFSTRNAKHWIHNGGICWTHCHWTCICPSSFTDSPCYFNMQLNPPFIISKLSNMTCWNYLIILVVILYKGKSLVPTYKITPKPDFSNNKADSNHFESSASTKSD